MQWQSREPLQKFPETRRPRRRRQPEAAEHSADNQAKKAVEELNRRYGERFILFVRARSYQKTQRCYQGWERKRGALLELARYIRGEEQKQSISKIPLPVKMA